MRTTHTLLLAAIAGPVLAQTTHTITTNLGQSFNPATLTVDVGDIINISLGIGHTATEVSEATWNSNGITSNGGFNFSTAGTHQIVPTTPGIRYYVCQNHVLFGMKGRIIVQQGTGIGERAPEQGFRFTPNPANQELTVAFAEQGAVGVVLIDGQGREVMRAPVRDGDRIGIGHLAEGHYVALLTDDKGATLAVRRLAIAR